MSHRPVSSGVPLLLSGLLTVLAVVMAARVGPRTVTPPALGALAPEDRPSLGGSAGGASDPELPLVTVQILQGLAALALLVVIVLLVRSLVPALRARLAGRDRRRVPDLRRFGADGADPDEALAVAAGAAADDLRRAISGQVDPSESVIRAWVRVEAVAAHLGMRRRDAETATEFTAGLLRHRMVDAIAVGTLLSVYGAARFGDAPLGADDLRTARDAFDTVHRELSRRAAP